MQTIKAEQMTRGIAKHGARSGVWNRTPALNRGKAARASVKARAKLNWLPGEASPDYLDGSMPGDYGFDPFKFGSSPKQLERYREAELIHGRWCMLAAAGILGTEAAGFGTWLNAPNWAIENGSASYLGTSNPFSLPVIVGVQLVLMAVAEALRSNEKDPMKRLYPGGQFDPMGLSKDAAKLEEMKLKEIKNGRLAMFSVAGFFAQGLATGNGPIADWQNHLADPWHVNVATNGVSVPIW